MRRKILLATLLLLGASLFFVTYVAADEPENYLFGRKIVLDAGHGGTDPGTTQCEALYEKDANLDIAFRLKARLEDKGATVYLTRDDDSYLTNEDRYDAANTTGSNALVSIHLNGSLDHTKNGTMTLYSKPRKDEEFTNILHNSMLGLGLEDLGTTNFMSGVILRFNGPASLLEPLYLSNDEECAALTDGTGIRQQQVADAILEGLNDWFSEEREVFISPGQFKN